MTDELIEAMKKEHQETLAEIRAASALYAKERALYRAIRVFDPVYMDGDATENIPGNKPKLQTNIITAIESLYTGLENGVSAKDVVDYLQTIPEFKDDDRLNVTRIGSDLGSLFAKGKIRRVGYGLYVPLTKE